MSSLLRHTPEGFRKEYLSKYNNRFEQGGGRVAYEVMDEGKMLYEILDDHTTLNKKAGFSPEFYTLATSQDVAEIAKLCGEGKLDDAYKKMLIKNVLYVGPYLKKNWDHPIAQAMFAFIIWGCDDRLRFQYNASSTEDEFVRRMKVVHRGCVIALRNSQELLMKGETGTSDSVSIRTLYIFTDTDIGAHLLMNHLNWPKAADGLKYETDPTIVKSHKASMFAAPAPATRDDRDVVIDDICTYWFPGMNNNEFIAPGNPVRRNFHSDYVTAAMGGIPYDQFYSQGTFNDMKALKQLLKDDIQSYMATPSNPNGTYFPPPIILLAPQSGGGPGDAYLPFSSRASDMLKGVKIYLAGTKNQAFSPESEKQIVSAIENVQKHEKEYFNKMNEFSSQKYASKYSKEENQRVMDGMAKNLTIKINRLKDLFNSIVTQALA